MFEPQKPDSVLTGVMLPTGMSGLESYSGGDWPDQGPWVKLSVKTGRINTTRWVTAFLLVLLPVILAAVCWGQAPAMAQISEGPGNPVWIELGSERTTYINVRGRKDLAARTSGYPGGSGSRLAAG